MKSPKEMSMDELKKALVDRVRKRSYNSEIQSAETCYLDLRGKTWGGIGTPVMRKPGSPGWPEAGETTGDPSTAENWIRSDDRYADWVRRKLQGQEVDITVADAVEPFIKALHDDPHLGPDHSTVSQRRSYLRVHVGPALGRHRLATLPNEAVQSWINSMTVRHTKHGVSRTVPASRSTREAALAALAAMYRHYFPGESSFPWGRIVIDLRKQEAARRRVLVRAGRARELVRQTAYSTDEMLRLMLTARYLDRHVGIDQSILAAWACPNLAVSMAFQVGLGARISELVQLRENSFEEDGFVLVPGTKSSSAIRFLPLQVALEPWLELARELRRGPRRPSHYLLRTHPDYDELPNSDVYARRMGRVQEIAGLKLPGKRSHIFRATHASHANMAGLPPHEIKLMLGHSNIFEGATDVYIQVIRQMTRDEHRTYLRIPSPDELDAILDQGWVPPNLPMHHKPTGRPKRNTGDQGRG